MKTFSRMAPASLNQWLNRDQRPRLTMRTNRALLRVAVIKFVVATFLWAGAVNAISFCPYLAGSVVDTFNYDASILTGAIKLEMVPDATRRGVSGLRYVQVDLTIQYFDANGLFQRTNVPMLAAYPSQPEAEGSCDFRASVDNLRELGVTIGAMGIEDVRVSAESCDPAEMRALIKSRKYVSCR